MTRARRNVPLIHTCPECGATKEWWASRLPFGLCASCRSTRKNQQRNREYHVAYALRTKYGITPAFKLAILDSQGNCCAICRTDDPGRGGWQTDHDHLTGLVRGVLCGNCNRGLGVFHDDPKLLDAAAAYLVEHRD